MISLTAYEYQGAPVPFAADGYVNLTAMCRRFDKRPLHFLQLASTQAFVAALSADTGLPEKSNDGNPVIAHGALMVTRRGGDHNKVRESHLALEYGTWAHPDLALECARWLSPSFAIWCNRIVREVLSGRADGQGHSCTRHLEVEIAQARADIARKVDLVARAKRIEGQVSVSVFLDVAGITIPPAKRVGGLARACQQHCYNHYLPIGEVEQRRPSYGDLPHAHGYRAVSTFPIEVIADEARRFGYTVPSLAPALYHAAQAAAARPRSGPRVLLPAPSPAAPAPRFPSFDFGHGAEVHA